MLKKENNIDNKEEKEKINRENSIKNQQTKKRLLKRKNRQEIQGKYYQDLIVS